MGNLKNTINFLVDFFFKNRVICLINAPQQYFSLVEFIEKKKINKKKLSIYIGYCDSNTHIQIKELIDNYYLAGKVFFLKECFSENFFLLILNLFKVFGRSKNRAIIGDAKYYLFKPIIKKTKKKILLDEGISLLGFNKQLIKRKNCQLFTVFNHLIKDNTYLNNYAYLKKNLKEKIIKENVIYVLGTALVNNEEILNRKLYINLINSYAKKNKDSKIFYIPHRREENVRENVFRSNIRIKNINMPIELFLKESNFLPSIIAGFYSMALINISIIFKNISIFNMPIKILNFKSEYVRKNFKLYKKIFSVMNIKQANLL